MSSAVAALRRPGARRVPLLAAGAIALAVLVLGVFPTRSFLAQRDAIATEKEKTAVLHRENQRLAARVDRLHTDVEIERLARAQYNLVKPGEEAYAILPGPADPADNGATPPAPPAPSPPGFWSRLWDDVTFWN